MNFLLDPAVAIYIAMAAALVVWLLIFGYLIRIDRQARELRRMLEREPDVAAPPAPRVSVESRVSQAGTADAEPQRRDDMKSATSL